MLLQNMIYYGGPIFLCALACVCMPPSTHEHVCNSHPWGHIDPAQVSPHMNNQTQLPSALPNQ